MKGGWQQEEGSQALSDGAALENEMSLVSMAANETFGIFRSEGKKLYKDVEDRQKHGRGKQGWRKIYLDGYGIGLSFHGS